MQFSSSVSIRYIHNHNCSRRYLSRVLRLIASRTGSPNLGAGDVGESQLIDYAQLTLCARCASTGGAGTKSPGAASSPRSGAFVFLGLLLVRILLPSFPSYSALNVAQRVFDILEILALAARGHDPPP
jgi:hypothetical protein